MEDVSFEELVKNLEEIINNLGELSVEEVKMRIISFC